MALVNKIIEYKGNKWKVRFADNQSYAFADIAFASVRGSVGSSTTINGRLVSDVVRLNEDGSERQPS